MLTLTRTPRPDLVPTDAAQVDAVHRPIALADAEQASAIDIVEEWGIQSFPASDPPANW